MLRRARLRGDRALRLVALDLDGTLLECRARQVAVLEAALRDAGVEPVDAGAWWRRKRAGATTVAALREQGLAEAVAEAVGARWRLAVEEDAWLALDAPLPRAAEALAVVRRSGCAALVLTARSRADAVAGQLAALGLAAAIDELVVVDPAAAADQKARVLRERRPLGFVGDTESDARAAAAAGVRFAAVTGGQRDARFLRAHGAGALHRDVLDAVRALLSAPA